MNVPLEIELYIISFIPFYDLAPVCKNWNKKIKSIRKKCLLIIENFYFKNKINYFKTNNDLIRYICVYYDNVDFLTYPELTVSKLVLNPNLLRLLPPFSERKRSDVKTWMLNMPISFSDWMYVVL